MADRDLMLSDAGELMIANGTFRTGESLTQEVSCIMLTCKGELKQDVFCGCDLTRRINARLTTSQLRSIVRVQLERDGKDMSTIGPGINLRSHG